MSAPSPAQRDLDLQTPRLPPAHAVVKRFRSSSFRGGQLVLVDVAPAPGLRSLAVSSRHLFNVSSRHECGRGGRTSPNRSDYHVDCHDHSMDCFYRRRDLGGSTCSAAAHPPPSANRPTSSRRQLYLQDLRDRLFGTRAVFFKGPNSAVLYRRLSLVLLG
ncbi:hypothetical protein JCM3775_006196 [Rhodotorula graminis]